MSNFEEKQKKTANRLGVPFEKLPRHIAIIMDGNGRWAQERNLPRIAGHQEGGKTVEKIVQHCVDFGIESLTLYSFSMENWRRPKLEVNSLMTIYSRYIVGTHQTLMKNNIKLIHLGRLEKLPENLQTELLETIALTANNAGMILALALNYSGRAELVDAMRKIAKKCEDGTLDINDISEKCISQHLYAPFFPEPDILIRTANEKRISNFLLWQISYTELYVTDVFWPDFAENDLEEAIKDYSKRTRRFGNINPEL